MAAPVDPSHFKEALIVLGAAAVVMPVFHRLKVSPVLGFMLVGMLVGPSGLGGWVAEIPWLDDFAITDPDHMAPVAELGVVLLLFVIGLEMSFERLKLLRTLVFGLGTVQVVASAVAIAGVCMLLGLPPAGSAAVGMALAMSSTAVVVQVLSDEKRLNTPTGRAAVAILLLQDIAVVPILFAVHAMEAGDQHGGLLASLGLGIGKAVLAAALVYVVGRLTLRPLFRSVARARNPEFFVAACLLVVLVTGLVTAVAGLSMAMGALIAGLLLAETEFRKQILVTIEPFKGLLLGVFLVSVGMSLSLDRVAAAPLFVVAMALLLVAVKLAIVAVAGRLFGLSWRAAARAGVLLGPGGEFGLVVVSAAIAGGLLVDEAADYAVVLAALTMAAIPVLSQVGERLLVARGGGRRGPREAVERIAPPQAEAGEPRRVIVAGFGRVGQTVAAMLEVHRVPYIAIDADPDVVARQRALGRPVYYGDMTQTGLLHHLDLDTARALVVTVSDDAAADALVAAARRERAELLVVARAHDADHAAHLYAVGATDAVPETIEASLQLAEAVLVDVGVPMGPVIASIHEKRAEFQAAIRAKVPGAGDRSQARRRLREALLHPAPQGGGGD